MTTLVQMVTRQIYCSSCSETFVDEVPHDADLVLVTDCRVEAGRRQHTFAAHRSIGGSDPWTYEGAAMNEIPARTGYWDKDGNPITLAQYCDLVKVRNYQVVAFDKAEGVEVSTLWLGFNASSSSGGPPILFESRVFGGQYSGALFRYATEEEALTAHNKLFNLVKTGRAPNL